MARTKKYVSSDKSYLMIDENDYFYIAWYLPDDDDLGAYLGDSGDPQGESPDDRDEWEVWTACKAVQPFALHRSATGFAFETEAIVRRALRAANEALNRGGGPWPEWAIRAQDAGWTPPKNWKP